MDRCPYIKGNRICTVPAMRNSVCIYKKGNYLKCAKCRQWYESLDEFNRASTGKNLIHLINQRKPYTKAISSKFEWLNTKIKGIRVKA